MTREPDAPQNPVDDALGTVREYELLDYLDALRSTARIGELVDDVANVIIVNGTSAVGRDTVAEMSQAAVQRADRSFSMLPSVVVGVGAVPSRFVDAVPSRQREVGGTVEEFIHSVRRSPEAATALALLLRGGDARSVEQGLVAESSTYSLLQEGRVHRTWLDARKASAPDFGGHASVLTRTDQVITLTFDRPDVRNAFGVALRDSLLDAVALVAADRTLRLVVDGNGPAFCSGGDLREFGSRPDPAIAHLVRLSRSAARGVADISDRVEFHLHGACVGAGIEVPSFARRVIADPDSRFRLPEVAFGLVPGAGGTVGIPRRIGRLRTCWWAISGAWIDARTALQWGLVDAVQEKSEVRSVTR